MVDSMEVLGMKKQILFLLIFLPFSLLGMGPKGSQPSSPTVKALFNERQGTLIASISRVPKGGFIGVESPFFSDKTIEKELQAARDRGVRVERHGTMRDGAGRAETRKRKAETEAKNNGKKVARKVTKSMIKPADVLVSGLHAKRVLISHIDPEKMDTTFGKENITEIFEGSDNQTACSQFHKEIMVKTKDPEYFREHYQYFKKDEGPQSPFKINKPIVNITPHKRSVTRSTDYDLAGSNAARIKRLFVEPTATDSIDINSMSFDADVIVKTVEEGYSNCSADKKPTMRFLLDRTAQNHPELLKRLQKAEGEHLKIFIYNKEADKKIFGKFPQLQHRKGINRKIGNEELTMISTGNLTNQSNREINYTSYHPNNSGLYAAIKQANDELAKESTKYQLPTLPAALPKPFISDID